MLYKLVNDMSTNKLGLPTLCKETFEHMAKIYVKDRPDKNGSMLGSTPTYMRQRYLNGKDPEFTIKCLAVHKQLTDAKRLKDTAVVKTLLTQVDGNKPQNYMKRAVDEYRESSDFY